MDPIEDSEDDDWEYEDRDNEVQDEFGREVEMEGVIDGNVVGSTNFSDSDADLDQLRSIASSDESNQDSDERCRDKRKRKRKKFQTRFSSFNKQSDMTNPTFTLGMEFRDHKLFRDAVKEYAIKRGKQIKFIKNEKTRVSAKCKEGCLWSIYASMVKSSGRFRVKSFVNEHNCCRSFEVKHLKTKWIVERYLERIRLNPGWPIWSLREAIIQEHAIKVDEQIVKRAKTKCLELIEGSSAKQYASLWGYIDEVKRCNLGTTICIKLDSEGQVEGRTMFKALYLCWGALKDGFLEGCRPVIGVDGYHLKGSHGGVLLTTVGLDANNTIYPFAYAVVESEKRETWQWFLERLENDLHSNSGARFNFMSDKQKGLIEAVADLFPAAAHRFCVRHLYNNFKQDHKGLVLKELLWDAARCTNIPSFTNVMEHIMKVNRDAYEWLVARPPIHWSRAYFDSFPKCDILLNNLCESFNSNILAAREKDLIIMLERIRKILMESVRKKMEAAKKWNELICPKVQKMIEKSKVYATNWIPVWNGIDQCEVCGPSNKHYQIDFKERTCGCRSWQLSGIPCPHVIFAVNLKGGEVEDCVHEYYKVDTYRRTYKHNINPINESELWPVFDYATIIPPPIKKKRGRKREDKRRKEPGEDEIVSEVPNKLSRRDSMITCSNCKKEGHNKRSCKTNTFLQVTPQVNPQLSRDDNDREFQSQETELQSQVTQITSVRHRPKFPVKRKMA